MSSVPNVRATLGAAAARELANTTKTPAQWDGTTPRWLVNLLEWCPVEAGVFRVNRVRPGSPESQFNINGDAELPGACVDYEPHPREYTLSALTTVLDVQTRVSDLYRSPHDQIREQMRLTVERVKERQEDELINNQEYGLVNQVVDS